MEVPETMGVPETWELNPGLDRKVTDISMASQGLR